MSMRYFASHNMLCCFLALLVVSDITKANDLLQIKEQVWLSPNITASDRLLALTQKPIECLNPDAPANVTIGRLAFESPALLGGQAARIGLSCASCHPSSRTNPHFFLENISNAPGTADVTHSFFSSTGGNDTLTAVAIPDLAKLNEMRIKDRESSDFRNKLHELIEVEFDGQTAPPLVIDALQSYLANINTQYCQTTTQKLQPIHLNDDWERLNENVNALTNYPDKEINQLLIRMARKRLEKIYLRYSNIKNQEINSTLITLSRQLEKLSLTNVSHKEQMTLIENWHKKANTSFVRLHQAKAMSMYEPGIVSKLITLEQDNNKKLSHK